VKFEIHVVSKLHNCFFVFTLTDSVIKFFTLMKKVLNVQESDTTSDATKNKSLSQKIICPFVLKTKHEKTPRDAFAGIQHIECYTQHRLV